MCAGASSTKPDKCQNFEHQLHVRAEVRVVSNKGVSQGVTEALDTTSTVFVSELHDTCKERTHTLPFAQSKSIIDSRILHTCPETTDTLECFPLTSQLLSPSPSSFVPAMMFLGGGIDSVIFQWKEKWKNGGLGVGRKRTLK